MNHLKEELGKTRTGKIISLDLYANFQSWTYQDHRDAISLLVDRISLWDKLRGDNIQAPLWLEISSIMTDYYALVQYHMDCAPIMEETQLKIASG